MNKNNLILIILGITSVIVPLILAMPIFGDKVKYPLLPSGAAVALFVGLLSITWSTYANFRQIDNSNKQLKEQLTSKQKEDSIFTFVKDIMHILNYPYDDIEPNYIKSIHIFEDVKYIRSLAKNLNIQGSESTISAFEMFSAFNSGSKYRLRIYFQKTINNPYIFKYLPANLQKEIRKYIKLYETTQHNVFSESVMNIKIVTELPTQKNDFFKIGSSGKSWDNNFGCYLILSNVPLFVLDRNADPYSQETDDYIVRIDTDVFEKFDKILYNIYYLANITLNHHYDHNNEELNLCNDLIFDVDPVEKINI